MLLGGGRSALRSINNENATMRSVKKSSSSSLSSGGGVFDENSMQSAKTKKGGGKSVRMALGPASSSSKVAGGKTPGPSRRRALGDISNRKPGGGGRGSKSGGGGGGSIVLKPSRSKSVSFHQTPGRTAGGGGGLKSGKTPFGSTKKKGLAPRRTGGASKAPSLSSGLAMAPASARKKAEFTLPKRQVSFSQGGGGGGGSSRRANPLSTNRKPKAEVREKAPAPAPLDAEPVEDVEYPAGGRVWHPSDFHDDNDFPRENLGFPYKHFLDIQEEAEERERERQWAKRLEEDEEMAKQIARDIAKDCDEYAKSMEDLVNTFDLEEDLTNDPQLHGSPDDDDPVESLCCLDDISI